MERSLYHSPHPVTVPSRIRSPENFQLSSLFFCHSPSSLTQLPVSLRPPSPQTTPCSGCCGLGPAAPRSQHSVLPPIRGASAPPPSTPHSHPLFHSQSPLGFGCEAWRVLTIPAVATVTALVARARRGQCAGAPLACTVRCTGSGPFSPPLGWREQGIVGRLAPPPPHPGPPIPLCCTGAGVDQSSAPQGSSPVLSQCQHCLKLETFWPPGNICIPDIKELLKSPLEKPTGEVKLSLAIRFAV